ncbi:MAG TPA: serine hydrolase domain-containing protein, partial [Pyrinomonadaceae bacterium]|nr:serine hydrolase domain-containing protein [Pyrinomonadaceae bacterium]
MPSRRRRAASIVLVSLFCAAAASAQSDKTDDYIKKVMSERHIPALALAVIRDGHVIKEKAYGFANLELKIPVTTDTVFLTASVTKLFTASAIMALVEDGKLSPEDKIR